MSGVCARNSDKPSRFEAVTLIAWYEARGESIKVQNLVVDSAYNRAIISDKSLYEVLKEPKQYPWVAKLKTWRLTTEQAEFGFKLLKHRSPVRSKVVYFNHVPHEFTKKNFKVGNLYFAVN